MKRILYCLPLAAASQLAVAANAFNPDTSVNILTLYQHHDSAAGEPENGFSLQEVELQFAADIDPYWRASALLSVSQGTPGGEFSIDPEEVYAETLQLPVTLRFGKFKTAIGKHNGLHTHAYPMIDAPLVNQTLLGDEGWNDVGASAAALIPGLPWFSEFTAQLLSGDDTKIFNSASKNDFASALHFKNLFDVSDAATVEFGLSDGFGKNAAKTSTNVFGADLTVKYRPVEGGKYSSLLWSAEYLSTNHLLQANESGGASDAGKADGLGTWLIYQFAQRWSVGTRYDILGLAQAKASRTQRESLVLGFFATEFSGLRLQYEHSHGFTRDNNVALQLNISMGAHPAHAY